MKETKPVHGKKKIVTSTNDLRVGDIVRLITGTTKSGRVKLSAFGYPIVGIIDDKTLVIEKDDEQVEVTVDKIRLELIVLYELGNILVSWYCRESGVQTIAVSEHDFYQDSSSCELCGSHGYLSVDVKCRCGKTHEIEIKSW